MTECTSSSSDGSPSPSDSCSSSRATGGTVTTDGDYTIHTFTSSHTFAVVDSTLNEVDVLVVGGGGGGSSESGGGGGGEVVYRSAESVTTRSYEVFVGDGGDRDSNGVASSFHNIIASGGYHNTSSHGGRSGGDNGNPGGKAGSYSGQTCDGAGGGGAGGPGNDGYMARGSDGGTGVYVNAYGAHYGGGGGGMGVTDLSGSGGSGGGGQGNQPGTANTGGGGGGACGQENGNKLGKKGGSGIVIIRYKTCSDQSCGTNYYHDGSDCVACPTGSTRMPETANQCLCPENHHRSVDGGVHSCAACAQGSTRLPGDTVPGGDATACTSSVSPPPPPPSAQALEKVAEETRDSILADIADERLKAKVKLLADAAIAGAKVQRLTARMSAADEDTACSNAFSGAGMSSGDGACVATAASSGKGAGYTRRRTMWSSCSAQPP